MEFTNAKNGIKLKELSQRKLANASKTNPIRRQCDLGEASDLLEQGTALLTPSSPLKRGLGDEIIPPMEFGHHGLEETLKEPDLLDCEVTIKRTRLADEAGVFEMVLACASDSVPQ
jgi:hypothetical protein